MKNLLSKKDPDLNQLIEKESKRQQEQINLIPSENFFSPAVRQAISSSLMHKYSEGNIDKRYYEGNKYIDEIEKLTIKRAKKLFSVPQKWNANVQALSGSNANLAVYLAVLQKKDTMMGMYLPDGGHLSHGWSYQPNHTQDPENLEYLGGERKVHITSRMYKVVQYKTDPDTQIFDYSEIEKIALKYKPKLIITGGTAYPREIDYKRMKAIAQKVNALYMADIAHEAGLVAAKVVNSPVGVADIVTMTTHKTLRSGRGAIILAHEDLIKKINRGVLPGLQGGPFNNNIAGICVGLKEAMDHKFETYAKQVLKNAKTFAKEFLKRDYQVVSKGTDKHLVLIDMTNKGIFGKYSAKALASAGIIVNMNTMPGETRSPADPSAIRLGSPFITTQGMKEKQVRQIVDLIDKVIRSVQKFAELDYQNFMKKIQSSKKIKEIKKETKELSTSFPLNF